MSTKTIKKQKIPEHRKLHTGLQLINFLFWVKFILFAFVWKIMRFRIRIHSVLTNHLNTNTNIIRFENIFRIRI